MKVTVNDSIAVATKDLADLINTCKGFEKTGSASFDNKNSSKKTSYKWIILDIILEHVKTNKKFALMQPLGQDSLGRPAVKNILIHESGVTFESDYFPIGYKDDDSPQNKGIAITYMRRYSLGAFLGLASETDNDGATDEKSDEDKAREILKAQNEKAQKEITTHFNLLLTKYGEKEAVYYGLGMTREEFLTDYQSTPADLLKQIRKHAEQRTA